MVHTLEVALGVSASHEQLSPLSAGAVNLVEDTDTVRAVAGGLAGLRYGMASIPKERLSVIARREEIEALYERFAASSF